jgi:hypothetical protein
MRRTSRRESRSISGGAASLSGGEPGRASRARRGQGAGLEKDRQSAEGMARKNGEKSRRKEAPGARDPAGPGGASSPRVHSPKRQRTSEGGARGEKPNKKGDDEAQRVSPRPSRPTRNWRRTGPRARLGRVTRRSAGAGQRPETMRSGGPGGRRGSRRTSNSSASSGGAGQPRVTAWPGRKRPRAGSTRRGAPGASGDSLPEAPTAKAGRRMARNPERIPPHPRSGVWYRQRHGRRGITSKTPPPAGFGEGAGASRGPRV